MVVTARKASFALNLSSARRSGKTILGTVGKHRLAIAVLSAGVAVSGAAFAAPPIAPSHCTKSAPCEPLPLSGKAEVAHLMAAAGADNVFLTAISSEPWGSLQKIVAARAPREVSRDLPWLTIKEPWTALQVALELQDNDSAETATPPAGWDPKRPLLLSIVNGVSTNPIEQINSIVFDGAQVPLHERVIVPATDAKALASAMQTILSKRPLYGAGANGRYLLELYGKRLAVAVIPADDHIRLELLYFTFLAPREGDKADMLSQLERVTNGYQPRTSPSNASATEVLLSNNHGIACSFQPSALARQLELEEPKKVMAALSNVDPEYKVRILAEGIAEILDGHLLVSSGNSEIAEAALSMNFDRGINVVGLAQLTALGKKQMAILINSSATPLKLPNTLASMALTFQPGSDLKKAEPDLGPTVEALSSERFFYVFREAGSMGWPALFAKPVGAMRKMLSDGAITSAIGNVTTLPQDLSFELLNFDRKSGPSVRLRAYVSNSVASTWSTLGRLLAQTTFANVKEQHQGDGTWITLNRGSQRPEVGVPSGRRSDLPNGTFAVAHVDSLKIATVAERLDPDLKKEQAWLLQLLRQAGQVQLSARLQSNWLVGELKTSEAAPSAVPAFETLTPTAIVDPVPRVVLDQAIAQAAELLHSLVEAADRAAIVSQGRAKLRNTLDQAKRDPASKSEAVALDRMLLKIEKMFRETSGR